jgi:uncharacterized protein DUF302
MIGVPAARDDGGSYGGSAVIANIVGGASRLAMCRSFEQVHRVLIDSVPALKPEVSEMLVRGEREKVAVARREWPKLSIFLVRNHGELTVADGLNSKAMQYEIGNPFTAERMTRHALAAGLYAPLRVILYEDESGKRGRHQLKLDNVR